MKVLHYVDTFSRLSETFIYDLIKSLQADTTDSKITHIVLCHKRENEKIRPCDNVKVIAFNYTKLRRLQIKLGINKWEIPSINKIHDYILAIKPDVIHAHFGHCGVRVADYFYKKGIELPLIVHCHGTDVISLPIFDKEYLNKIKKIGEREKVVFLGNTDFLCNTIKNLGISDDKIKKVRLSLNQDFLNNLNTNNIVLGENKMLNIISVGRLIKWKGHKYLLEAIHYIYNNVTKDIRLTIVGEGEEMDALKALTLALKIKEIVTFIGAVNHAEVKKIILEHNLLVQPSIIDDKTKQRESFGLTILEAIACSLPVIVTNTGGMPELVGGETPYSKIVEAASVKKLAEAIVFFINNPIDIEGMRKYSKNRLNLYSLDNQINALYKIYNTILNE